MVPSVIKFSSKPMLFIAITIKKFRILVIKNKI